MATKFTVSVVLKAIDKITKPVKKMGASLKKLVPKIKAVGKALKEATKKGMDLFTKLSAAIVAAGIAASGFVLKFTAIGDSIAKTADKIGISTDLLQKWRFAAELSGVAQETFDMSIQRFTRRLGEAKKGQGELVKGLVDLRIHLKKDAKTWKTSEEVFLEYMDGLDNTKDSTTKLMLATKAFDSEGAKLVNMAKGGSKAINAMGDELVRINGLIEEDVLRASEKFGDTVTKVLRAIRGFAFNLLGDILPFAHQKMKDLLLEVTTNGEEIKVWIRDAVKNIIAFGEGFWAGFKEVVIGIRAFIKPILKWLGITDDLKDKTKKWVKIGNLAVKMMASLVALKFAAVIVSMVTPFVMLAWAIALLTKAMWANPVMLIIGLFTTLGLLIAGISTNFMGMGDRFKRGWKKILAIVVGWKDTFVQMGKDIVTWLWDGIKEMWADLTAWIDSKIAKLFQPVSIKADISGLPISPARAIQSGLAGFPGGGEGGASSFQGNLKISIDGPPGTRITEFDQTKNSDFNVDTGISIGGK